MHASLVSAVLEKVRVLKRYHYLKEKYIKNLPCETHLRNYLPIPPVALA